MCAAYSEASQCRALFDPKEELWSLDLQHPIPLRAQVSQMQGKESGDVLAIDILMEQFIYSEAERIYCACKDGVGVCFVCARVCVCGAGSVEL